MRINEKYERDGYFWLPENSDRKIPGTLRIYDGGKIELELMGLLDEDIAVSLGKRWGLENTNIYRVVGQVEKDEPITLEDCTDIPQIGPDSIPFKSLVHVDKAFCGFIYEQNESVKFNSVMFSVEGLDDWLGKNGINFIHSDDQKTTTNIEYELMDGFKLHIGFSYTPPSFSHTVTVETKTIRKAYIKLSSTKEREFQDFREIIYKITYLLCFTIDKTVTISDVSATLERQKGTNPIHIYYKSLPFSPNRPEIDPRKALFGFGDIKDDMEGILNKWFDAYVEIRPSINLYLSVVTESYRYLEGKFLALVHALEIYHRRTSDETKKTKMSECEFKNLLYELLSNCPDQHKKWLKDSLCYANEISLRTRINRIIEPYKDKFGNSKERNELISKIVDTRNYLIHYDKSLEEKAAKGKDLLYYIYQMKAIFKLHLLQRLDIDKSRIDAILKNNYEFKERIKEVW